MSHSLPDPYDPPHPDGPVEPHEFPLSPAGLSWLDDEDALEAEPPSSRFLVNVDPE
jgi:hypothetical protein